MTLVTICLVLAERMHLSGTVMEIWCPKDNFNDHNLDLLGSLEDYRCSKL